MKTLLILALAALTFSAFSQTNKPTLLGRVKAYTAHGSGDLFGKETTVDLGVSYTIAEPNGLRNVARTDADHGDWGVSLGAMQWPNAYVGFGFSVGVRDWNNVSSEVLDYAATTFAVRYPIKSVAPGVIGAVGRDWADGLYYFQVGPRMDWRWNRNLGAFVQAPFTFRTAENRDTLDVTFGVSLTFK